LLSLVGMSDQVGHNCFRSRWAARLTILSMLSARHVPWDVPENVFLTTLTFANPEPPYEEARKRFNSFASNFLRAGDRFGVAAPEFGKRTKRLHFHLVTTVEIPESLLRVECPKYGFGFPDVRSRPAWRPGKEGREIHPAAWYLAKYVGKRVGWPEGLKGMRQWSVFGEKHFPRGIVKTRDVRITRKVLTSEGSRWKFPVWPNYVISEPLASNVQLLHPPEGSVNMEGRTQMRELSEKEKLRVLAEITAGNVVAVGDYRFGETVEREYASFRDSSVKVKRVAAVHQIDVGPKCDRLEVNELLSQGADTKSFALPAKTGDVVMVVVEGISKYTGGTTYRGRVVKL